MVTQTQTDVDRRVLTLLIARLEYEYSVLINRGDTIKAARKLVALEQARRQLTALA